MATISAVVRWADNTADLKRNLAEGLNQIEATRASAEKMVQALSGEKLIAAAHKTVAAINQIGATALTASEAASRLSLLEKAMEKMALVGQPIPDLMKRTAAELQAVASATKQATDPTDSLNVSWGKLIGSFITAQAIIGVVKGAFNAITGEITSSIKAANEAEKAHVQLVAALRAQGTAVPSVISAYEGYATALQKTTIYQDEALEGAAALLVTVGNVMPRDMKRALEATTNLASGLGIDLHAATMMVAKAAEGNITALKKAGVQLDETKGKAHDFGDVLDKITEKFGGQAAAIAGTYEGRLTQLANTWNNVEESIGRAIIQNATVLEVLNKVNQAIETNTGELKDNATATNLISAAVIGTVKAFGLVAQALDIAQTAGAGFIITMREGAIALGRIGVVALEAARTTAMMTGNFAGVAQANAGIAALQAAVAELGTRNKNTTERSIAFGNALQGIVGKANELATELEKTRGKTVALTSSTDDSADAWKRQTKAVGDANANLDAWNKTAAEVLATGAHWVDTVNTIDAAVVEGIKYYLERGKTVEQLATFYGLLKTQVEAVAQQMKFEQSVLDATNKVFKDMTATVPDLSQRTQEFNYALQGLTKDGLIPAAEGFDDLSRAELANKLYTDELERSHAALQRQLAGTIGLMPDLSGQAKEHMREITDETEATRAAAERSRLAFESLADTFVRLGQASGGSLGSILNDIGQMLVLLDGANKEVAKFQKIRDARIGGSADGKVGNFGVATALFAGKDSTGMEKLASAAASAGAIVQGVKNIWAATESHATRAGNAVGGMLAGFKAGAAFGPWGMAIGAAAGLVVGLIRGKPAWAQAAESVGKDFGVQISKGLADAIAKSAKTDFGGSMQAAQIGALAAIIKEAGGLSEKNLPQMTARLHDVFSMIETHQMTIEQGTKVLEETWGAFAQAGTDSLGLLSPKLVEIIKLQRQFGTESKAIADYVKGQLAGVAEGFNAVAIAIAGPMSKVTDLTKEQIAKLAIDSQEAFDRTTRLAVVAFAAAIASGKGFLAAIDAIGPGLDALAAAMEKLGLQGSDTLNQLLLFRKFAQENKELVAGIDGLNQMMTGLANSGMLTQDVFDDLSATAFDFYQKAMKGGLTSTQALVMMQPTLQRIWQLHKDNGLAIDENTQKMLDEAEANGIVGDAMRSTNEKMLQVLVAIAKVLGADLPEAFDRLGSAADKAAQDAKDAIDKLPKKIDIPIDFPMPGGGPPPIPNPFPETAHSGAMVTADGLQKFHRGTAKVLQFHRGGLARDEVPAILQTGESVLNRQATSFLGGDVIGGLNRGIRGTIGPDGIIIHNEITVEVDARGALNDPAAADRIARQIGPAIVKQIQLNVDGMYTKMRGSLGLAS